MCNLVVDENKKIYGNCQVLSPDGILMFRCDEKKLNWYLDRNLAEEIDFDDNRRTIRLTFTPRGLGNHEKEFGLSEMKNLCVICGTDKFLTKHHIVPICYRKYFPIEYKSHNFHDVLSICIDCHESYERKADELKLKLSIEYNAPLNGEIEINRDLIKFVKIANTLLRKDILIPKIRKEKIKNELKEYLNIKRLTNNQLNKIIELSPSKIKKTHGEMVIEKIDSIQDFVEMWRNHFISNNDCKNLPENWSIKTNCL